MKIVIHGGMHKTATTAVQMLLSRNHPLLTKHQIHYPAFDSHHASLLLSGDQPWRPQALLEEVQLAQSRGCHTLMLSAEGVSVQPASQLHAITSALGDHDVRFVYAFRHWNEFLPSRWAQNNMMGAKQYSARLSDIR